ncbi:MAG: hypothetical protein NPMRTHETA2_2870004 [Nitrosopumilales archaeon]|nr:MAG: hypothetical protein NPMRTHETA2_2870004 [Nitrosopumilales archaeon]
MNSTSAVFCNSTINVNCECFLFHGFSIKNMIIFVKLKLNEDRLGQLITTFLWQKRERLKKFSARHGLLMRQVCTR